MNSYMHPLVNKGAKNDMKVSDENALKGPVFFPKVEEQKSIARYFASLDALITLHQCKPYKKVNPTNNVWEQRKLCELAEKVSEKNKNNEFDEPFTNSAEQGIISQKEYFDREVVNAENLDGYYIVRENDFVYNPRVSVSAPVGPINRNRLGRNGVMSPLYTVFRTHDIDEMYLEYYYKTTLWHRFMKLNGDSGARFDRFTISSSLFMEMPIPYPRVEEQKMIGGYFEALDNLITLHQCKPNSKAKNRVLAWEQRKLGEICERVTRKNKNNESDLPLTIASQHGLIDQRDFFNKVVAAKDMSNYYLLKKGEFAYNKSYSNGFDYGSIKRLNAYEQGCLSTLYICFGITSDEVESDYLECFFDTLKWYGDVSMICAEGARNHGLLNVDTKGFFDEVTIDLPKSWEEQKKISAYLNALDNLVTLHQRQQKYVKNSRNTLFYIINDVKETKLCRN